MELTTLARIAALQAELEALKVDVEVLKRKYPKTQTGGHNDYMFEEKASEMRGISNELQVLSR